MNTKKALSLILLVSLLSQGNAFGMFKKVSKFFRSVNTSAFYNTKKPSTAVLFSRFLTEKVEKPMDFNKLEKENEYLKIKNKVLEKQATTNKKIFSEIKTTKSQLVEELSGMFGNNLLFNAATAFAPTALFRVPANIWSNIYVMYSVNNSINNHMDNLIEKLIDQPKNTIEKHIEIEKQDLKQYRNRKRIEKQIEIEKQNEKINPKKK